jgi:Protein of unknown function (DUF3592)
MLITHLPKLFNWLKSSVLLIAGLFTVSFFFFLMADSWEKYQSRNWPSAKAQIDSAKVEIVDETNQGHMTVSYSYVVNKQLFIREISEKSSKKSPLHDEQKKNWRSYLSGQDITIYYKPNMPEVSLIAKERMYFLKDFVVLMLGAGLILLLGGTACIYASIDGFRTNK